MTAPYLEADVRCGTFAVVDPTSAYRMLSTQLRTYPQYLPLANHRRTNETPHMGVFDDIVMRTALIDGRRNVARGLPIDEAARLACVGAWRPYRDLVARRLGDEAAGVTPAGLVATATSEEEQAA